MRIRISNQELPGYTSEAEVPIGNEEARAAVYHGERYIGTVVYVRRNHKAGGSSYGWVPEKNRRAKLTDKAGAVRRLANF